MAIMYGLTDLFDYGSLSCRGCRNSRSRLATPVPKSLMPDLVEASLYQSWAWSARGHGYARKCPAPMAAVRTSHGHGLSGLGDIAERGLPTVNRSRTQRLGTPRSAISSKTAEAMAVRCANCCHWSWDTSFA